MNDPVDNAYALGAQDYWDHGKHNPYQQDTPEWQAYEDGYSTQKSNSWSAKEGGMSKRKGLNDVLSNDRSISRAAQSYTDDLFSGAPSKGGKSSGSDWSGSHKCYKNHPPLKLPGTDLVIYGGSCSDPIVIDADVYVGFDGSMRWTERHYPWKKGDEVYFRIPDMGVPAKPEEFKKLVNWVRKQLEEGKKIHCGCIGGHGRTGTFFAALVSTFGVEDAVTYVRQNYCTKAVESKSQMEFLKEHFGVTPIAPAKGATSSNKSHSNVSSLSDYGSRSGTKKSTVKTYGYLKGGGSIWE